MRCAFVTNHCMQGRVLAFDLQGMVPTNYCMRRFRVPTHTNNLTINHLTLRVGQVGYPAVSVFNYTYTLCTN